MIYNKYTLKELATIRYGKNQKNVVSLDGSFPIYGTGGLMGYASKYLYDKPSVLIGRKGTIDKVRYVTHPFWTVDTLFYTEINDAIVLPHFLYYVLSLLDLRKYNEGTSIPSLRTETLNRLELYIPPLSEQKKILSFIEPIEEKIDINSRINRNLSEQLKVIFSKMFPTIADNGSNTLEEIISFSNGKKRPDTEGKVPVYGGNGILSYTDKSNAENCVIIGRVGAYCGSLYLSIEPCWISDNAIKAEAKNSKSQMFIYYLLQELALSNRHIGTSQPLLTQGILNAIPFTCPSEEGIISFCKKANDIQKLIDMNTIENKRLSELRDTLLPKLMSGELDVSLSLIHISEPTRP